MDAKGVEDALSPGMAQLHIFIGNGHPIFTGTKVEGGNEAALIVDRQYPADHGSPTQRYLYASGRAVGSAIPCLPAQRGYPVIIIFRDNETTCGGSIRGPTIAKT